LEAAFGYFKTNNVEISKGAVEVFSRDGKRFGWIG